MNELLIKIDAEIAFAKGCGMPQFVMGLLQAKQIIEQHIKEAGKQHTTKYPAGQLQSGTPRNQTRVPVATPAEIAHRVYIEVQHIRAELAKPSPDQNHDAVNKLLWSIQHGATALSGILARLDGGNQ